MFISEERTYLFDLSLSLSLSVSLSSPPPNALLQRRKSTAVDYRRRETTRSPQIRACVLFRKARNTLHTRKKSEQYLVLHGFQIVRARFFRSIPTSFASFTSQDPHAGCLLLLSVSTPTQVPLPSKCRFGDGSEVAPHIKRRLCVYPAGYVRGGEGKISTLPCRNWKAPQDGRH